MVLDMVMDLATAQDMDMVLDTIIDHIGIDLTIIVDIGSKI